MCPHTTKSCIHCHARARNFPRIFFVSVFSSHFFLVFFCCRQVLLYLMQHLESSQDTVQLIQRRFQFCRSKLDSMRSELQARHIHAHTCTCVCRAERLVRVFVLRMLHLVCVSSYYSCSAAYVCPDATHAAPHLCVLILLGLHLICVLVLGMQHLTYVSSYYYIIFRRRKT